MNMANLRIIVEFPDGNTYEAIRDDWKPSIMHYSSFAEHCDNCSRKNLCNILHPDCFVVFGHTNFYFQKIYTNGKNDDIGLV